MSEPMATACYCGTCPTCLGTAPRPPVADPLAFRHQAIKRRLLARISATEIDGARALERLGTRQDDDPAIALIDSFAGSLHILAWNARQLFDDGSIRRTQDRDALTDLTRLLGYEPRPALAATTTIAFTLDDFDQSPKVVTIPKGMKVASIPGQGETPQVFETDADLEARIEWNALKPVLPKDVPPVSASTASIVIAGTATTAKTGDLVLVYLEPQTSPVKWLCARIANVVRFPNPEAGPPQTRIDLTSKLTLPVVPAQQGPQFQNRVIILGQRAAAFGATAPDIRLMSDDIKTDLGNTANASATDWKEFHMPTGTANGGKVDLDAIYADAMRDRFVVFSRGTSTGSNRIGRILSVVELSRKDFGLSAKVSQIDVRGVNLTATASASFRDKVRETTIYLETARETLLVMDEDEKLPTDAAPDRITVVGEIDLPVGRRLVLTGEPWSAPLGQQAPISEVATLLSSSSASGATELIFEKQLVSDFHSITLSVLANCAGASQGETPASGAEPIGSGDAAVPTPRFQLKRSPLAYVPASNPRGYAPAIEVRVNDRLYAEQPSIFELDSGDHAYTVKSVRDGKSELQFAGRLPSGTHNVSALYRTGGGMAGNLEVGRITTLMAPIAGVRGARNPVPADGGSDAETIDDMRTAAPQSIRTLDRVVSLGDFEAFARSYRGIGKAAATELRAKARSIVCLTIATTTFEPPTPGSDIIVDLSDELARVTVPGRIIRIEGFTDLTAQVTVALAIDPAFRRGDIEAAVRAQLGLDFGRAARNFGEALHRSAILAAIHKVEGVIAATLPVFMGPNGELEDEGRLFCPVPTLEGDAFTAGGLLSIDPNQIQFAEMLP